MPTLTVQIQVVVTSVRAGKDSMEAGVHAQVQQQERKSTMMGKPGSDAISSLSGSRVASTVLYPGLPLVGILLMGFAVRVRSAGQKYGPTCHQRDRADVTEFVTLVRLSSLGQHVGVLALAGYKRRKSALTAGTISLCDMFASTASTIKTCADQAKPAYQKKK